MQETSLQELFDSNPGLKELLTDCRGVIADIYLEYFKLEGGLDAVEAARARQEALERGFRISVKREGVDLKTIAIPSWAVLDIYFSALCSQLELGPPGADAFQKLLDKSLTPRQRTLAIHFGTLFLINLRYKLEQEIGDAVSHSIELAKLEIMRQAAPEFDWKARLKKINSAAAKRRNSLEGLKHGGARSQKGIEWTHEKYEAFYQAVESTLQINGQSFWVYACEHLIENQFDADTIRWIKTRRGFERINLELFMAAIKCWRKYDAPHEVGRHDKPRVFEFRQALIDLGLRSDYTVSTMESYFQRGKQVSDSKNRS